MDRIPKPGECYRHFKNKLYQIITVAEHTETGEKMVVYQALYGTFGTYVRPLSMFVSEVDYEKYPEVTQKYRFERVEPGEAADQEEPEDEPEHTSRADNRTESGTENGTENGTECGLGEAAASSKNLLAFLDAETYDEKLKVLRERRDIFSDEELAAVCESLEVGNGTGTSKDMYRAAANFLEMQAKYDGARLR